MDFSHLSADTAFRFRAVADVLRRFGEQLPERPTLLDVGGYPGTFAREFTGTFPRWKGTTLDRPQEELPDYVSGAGQRLPFADKQFHAVVSIDTFEHISPEDRGAFLAELARVSSHLVVVACPIHHDSTATVEHQLNETHRRVFGVPHPWLYEHVQYGLPRMVEFRESWPKSHGLVHGAGSYELQNWTQWHALWMLRKLRGDLDNLWQGYENELASAPVPAVSDVPYRIVLAGLRGAGAIDWPHLPPRQSGQAAVALARMLCRLIEMELQKQNAEAGSTAAIVIEQRLTMALEAAERRVEELQSQIELARQQSRPSGIFRIFGKP